MQTTCTPNTTKAHLQEIEAEKLEKVNQQLIKLYQQVKLLVVLYM
jgi:hypothetical protein